MAVRAVGASPRDHMAETCFAEELSVTLGPRRANGWLASTRKVGACRCTPTLARGPSVCDCLRQLQEERQASLALDTNWQQNEGVHEYSEGDAPALAPPDNVVDSFFVEQLTATLGPRSASNGSWTTVRNAETSAKAPPPGACGGDRTRAQTDPPQQQPPLFTSLC